MRLLSLHCRYSWLVGWCNTCSCRIDRLALFDFTFDGSFDLERCGIGEDVRGVLMASAFLQIEGLLRRW